MNRLGFAICAAFDFLGLVVLVVGIVLGVQAYEWAFAQ